MRGAASVNPSVSVRGAEKDINQPFLAEISSKFTFVIYFFRCWFILLQIETHYFLIEIIMWNLYVIRFIFYNNF